MLHVIIDTSIYRQDPKQGKGAFRALTRLCEGGKIALYMPEYVKGEFVSQQKLDIEAELNAVISAAKYISRRSANSRLVKFSEDATEAAEKLLPKVGILAAEEFSRWSKRCKVIKCKIKPDHAISVMNDYFRGSPPFRSPKERKDIPDSFIWQTVLDLAGTKKTVHFAVADGALSKAAQRLSNIKTYETLDAFIESVIARRALEELTGETVARNIKRAIKLFSENEETLRSAVESE